jgi:hypothetical protein
MVARVTSLAHTLALRLAAATAAPSVPPPAVTVQVQSLSPDPIDHAVIEACVRAGIARERLGPGFNLSRTGKLESVLIRAGETLGLDPGLVTVADVVAYLRQKVPQV